MRLTLPSVMVPSTSIRNNLIFLARSRTSGDGDMESSYRRGYSGPGSRTIGTNRRVPQVSRLRPGIPATDFDWKPHSLLCHPDRSGGISVLTPLLGNVFLPNLTDLQYPSPPRGIFLGALRRTACTLVGTPTYGPSHCAESQDSLSLRPSGDARPANHPPAAEHHRTVVTI